MAVSSDAAETKLMSFFLEKWQEAKKGNIYTVQQIAIDTGANENEVISSAQKGIKVLNNFERRWQNIVFAGNGFLALDTEETVRTCLTAFLKKAGYRVVGMHGREVDFKSHYALRKIIDFNKHQNMDAYDFFEDCFISNGIDLVAFKEGKALIIELKGVTAVKSDLNDAIFQMFDRFNRLKAVCSEIEFQHLEFACAFPYFEPFISKEHYQAQFTLLDTIKRNGDARLLYKFAAATNTKKEDGLKKMQPFVEGDSVITTLIGKTKIRFLLVESSASVQVI